MTSKLWTTTLVWGLGTLAATGCASIVPKWAGGGAIPEASGPFAVGGTRFDHQVGETGSHDARKIEIRAWYPANASDPALSGAERVKTFEPALAKEMAETFGVPEVAFEEEETGAFQNVSAAEGQFPVLVFNHGFSSFARQNASQFEDLASHGFVVLSLNHPGDSLLTTYDDGTTVPIDRTTPSYTASQELQEDLSQMKPIGPIFDELRAARLDPERHRALRRKLSEHKSFTGYSRIFADWKADTLSVLDALPVLDREQPILAGRLDVERVGLFGHSLGGMVMAHIAEDDGRARALLAYDSPLVDFSPADAPRPQLQMAACFLYADTVEQGEVTYETDQINDGLLVDAPTGSCSMKIDGAGHLNFSDLNNAFVLRFTPVLGSVNQADMAALQRTFTRDYFAYHLRGAAPPKVRSEIAELRWWGTQGGGVSMAP